MYTLLYFSPSGNVKYLAEILADRLGRDRALLVPLETADPERLEGGGHLVLLYPIHGFNPPRNVVRFVRRLPGGRFERVSLIAVGSSKHWVNRAASYRLRRVLTEKGYAIGVEELLAMPLTIFVAFPDEEARQLVADAVRRMDGIAVALDAGRSIVPVVPWKARVISLIGRGEALVSRLFGLELRADGRCTSCGVCWNRCPQGNIRRGRDGKPRFGFDCLMCLRCVYECPERAIAPRISKFIPIRGGYALSRYLGEGRRPS